MTSLHPLEIELKLALPQEQVARFQKLMARRRSVPTQQNLVTRYFDTPDFSLSAQGVALRVRRIGRRWLQTIKTEGARQGGLSQRAEYEMAISRGEPDWDRFPDAAQALVPEALRDQLLPVFETRFRRTAWLIKGQGGAQIEVALDEGEVIAGGRSQPICEIELELKSGQPDALFALAHNWAAQLDVIPLDISKAERGVRLAHGQDAAPVRSMSLALDDAMRVEDGFAVICQSCLAQFQANLPGVLASDDIEYVHQARVALRRLRAALRVYRRVSAVPDVLLDGLRGLMDTLGPVRDWDVLCCETLPAIAPHHADADAWQQGFGPLDAHRAGMRASMRASLMQAHPGAWLLSFQRWLLQDGWRDAPAAMRRVQQSALKKWARQSLQKGHRTVVRDAGRFRKMDVLQRHAFRIAIKRQRYATEFFKTLFGGRRYVRYQSSLQRIQDDLGGMNDMRMAQRILMKAPVDAGSLSPFVLGWLAALLVEGAKGKRATAVKNFVKLTPGW